MMTVESSSWNVESTGDSPQFLQFAEPTFILRSGFRVSPLTKGRQSPLQELICLPSFLFAIASSLAFPSLPNAGNRNLDSLLRNASEIRSIKEA